MKTSPENRPRSVLDAPALRNMFNSTVCTLDYDAPEQDSCAAIFDGISLGLVEIFYLKNPSLLHGWRSIEHIRSDRVDDILVFIPLNSERQNIQAGRCSIVAPGSFSLLTTSKPFVSDCASNFYAEYVLRVPGSLLRQVVADIDDCCGRSLEIRPGAGRVMHNLVEIAFDEGTNLSRNYASQFGALVVDTIVNATLTAPELEFMRKDSLQSSHERIRDRAMEYIDKHLPEPTLDVAEIARHCCISIRSLHAAFSTTGITTVSAYIRDARLRRCREALQNPTMQNKLIIEIAMRWGFNDAAHFSHIYKARYGKSPKEDRARPPT